MTDQEKVFDYIEKLKTAAPGLPADVVAEYVVNLMEESPDDWTLKQTCNALRDLQATARWLKKELKREHEKGRRKQ